MSIIEDDDETY